MLFKREPVEEIYTVIGRNIKQHRGNISQADLAVCLGLKRPISISDIERGKARITVHALIDIAEFFGISVDSLIREED
jgi:transcriptional regulator with XRE-family HTH domain